MAEDPIVEEIHRVREKLLEEYGGFDGYLEHLKDLQEELKDRLVTRTNRVRLSLSTARSPRR